MMGRRPGLETQKGASLAEFALVAPLFVVLLFGLVEFGLAMYTKEVVNNASREGARLGVIFSTPRKTSAEITTRVQEYLNKTGFPHTVSVNVSGAGGASGNLLSVRVAYPYNFQVLPNFLSDFLGTINLDANTVMLME